MIINNQITFQYLSPLYRQTDIQNNMENNTLTTRRDPQHDPKKVKNIKKYLQNRVMPVLGPLQIAILQNRPEDIASFSLQFLKDTRNTQMSQKVIQEIDIQEVPEQIFREMAREKIKKQRKGSRRGIVGDRPKAGFIAVGKDYLSEETKSHEQQDEVKLMMYLKKCMFFEHLSSKDLMKVVERMQRSQFSSGDVIIQQGDNGNQLFVVESGMLKCQQKGNPDILKYYTKGQIFGQLSLLYNNPRATTVTAVEGGKLFSLQRQYFSAIMHLAVNQKLRQCESLVNKIDIFDTLNIYEKTKLYESMQLKNVGAEKYIIREGEQGSCFYIVAQGQLVAYKEKDGENKLVYAYRAGDYFGEMALLKNGLRQASVKTVTDVRLYFIDGQAFSRILGPLETILRRNQERYSKWASSQPQ